MNKPNVVRQDEENRGCPVHDCFQDETFQHLLDCERSVEIW